MPANSSFARQKRASVRHVMDVEEELARLLARRAVISGADNKNARKKLNKKIRELENKRSEFLVEEAKPSGEPSRGQVESGSVVLDASSLPPFKPPVSHVLCAHEPESILAWAFTCCIPSTLRAGIFASNNKAVAANYSPGVQWADSVYHVVHHYETLGCNKFKIEDVNATGVILLEIHSLRACPDTQGAMRELKREDFIHAPDRSVSLGPVPVFFVRFLHLTKEDTAKRGGTDAVFSQIARRGDRIVDIEAASAAELHYGVKALTRGQKFLSNAEPNANNHSNQFRESVLFPPDVALLKSSMNMKAEKVCAFCLNPASDGVKLRPCSRCKVTCYCSKKCQKYHWKAGHQQLCRPASESTVGSTGPSARRSFVFDAATAQDPNLAGYDNRSAIYTNHRTGHVTSNLGKKVGIPKTPTTRNAHGDKEFIVKLQPPNLPGFGQPWMCYDGPVKSFQAFIPSDTPGLSEVGKVLKNDGVWMMTPMGVMGNKGYCMARWEASKIRVFFDCLATPQPW